MGTQFLVVQDEASIHEGGAVVDMPWLPAECCYSHGQERRCATLPDLAAAIIHVVQHRITWSLVI